MPRGGLGHAVTHQASATFSPMHEGFCLQLSYILKQIWEQPVFSAWENHDGTLFVCMYRSLLAWRARVCVWFACSHVR